jgi:hypothetical protein
MLWRAGWRQKLRRDPEAHEVAILTHKPSGIRGNPRFLPDLKPARLLRRSHFPPTWETNMQGATDKLESKGSVMKRTLVDRRLPRSPCPSIACKPHAENPRRRPARAECRGRRGGARRARGRFRKGNGDYRRHHSRVVWRYLGHARRQGSLSPRARSSSTSPWRSRAARKPWCSTGIGARSARLC